MIRCVTVALLSILLLAGCSEVTEFLGLGRCSSYNGSRDSFRLEVDKSGYLAAPGDLIEVSYQASWLDDYLKREYLNCAVEWDISDPSVVQQSPDDPNSFVVLSAGLSRVTAVVKGPAGTKADSTEILALPTPTEVEPNNGTASATELQAGVLAYGQRDYNGDVDYYAFYVPAGASFQVDMGFPVDLSEADYFSRTSLSGSIYHSSGSYAGEPHRTYTNSGAGDYFYARVTPYSTSRIPNGPYEVFFHLIE